MGFSGQSTRALGTRHFRTGRRPESSTRVPVSGASGKQPAATAPKPIPSCEQIARRLKRFYPAAARVPMPKSCYQNSVPPAAPNALANNPELTFAIAIVPNPVQTHLPLVFDRT